MVCGQVIPQRAVLSSAHVVRQVLLGFSRFDGVSLGYVVAKTASDD